MYTKNSKVKYLKIPKLNFAFYKSKFQKSFFFLLHKLSYFDPLERSLKKSIIKA